MLKLQQGPRSSFELRGPCLCWGATTFAPVCESTSTTLLHRPLSLLGTQQGAKGTLLLVHFQLSKQCDGTHALPNTPALRIHGPQEQHPSRSPSVPNNRRSPLTRPFLAQAKQGLRGAGQKEAWIVFGLRQNLALRGRERGTTRHRNTPPKKEPD